MNTFNTTVCIAALFAGTAALADLTAVQVWDDWQTNIERFGNTTLTVGSEEIANGVVTVSDVALTTRDADLSILTNLGTLTFADQDDGSVAVQVSDSVTVVIESPDENATTLNISQSGMAMTVLGDDQSLSYDVRADSFDIAVADIIEGGQSVLDGNIQFRLNDVAGTYGVATGELRDMVYNFAIGSMDFLADVTEPDGADTVLISGKIETIVADQQISMPVDAADSTAVYADGLAIRANYGFQSANLTFDLNTNGSTAAGAAALGAGSLAFAFDKDNIRYGVDTNALTINLQSSDLPIPVDVTLAKAELGFAMPVSATDDPQNFEMKFNLTDLSASDAIWDLGDPAKTLSRDPITVGLDMTGQIKLLVDLIDPAQAAARNAAQTPATLYALNLNNLLVSAVGTRLTGTGAFTFDNNDLTTFNGLPRPQGDATFEISGANALIDNLLSMGLLQLDQASSGRFMMGLFARSVGDDQLQSTVEVNEQGHLIVNGQRMQ